MLWLHLDTQWRKQCSRSKEAWCKKSFWSNNSYKCPKFGRSHKPLTQRSSVHTKQAKLKGILYTDKGTVKKQRRRKKSGKQPKENEALHTEEQWIEWMQFLIRKQVGRQCSILKCRNWLSYICRSSRGKVGQNGYFTIESWKRWWKQLMETAHLPSCSAALWPVLSYRALPIRARNKFYQNDETLVRVSTNLL